MEEKKYTVKSVWSSEADGKFANDFCYACNNTFGSNTFDLLKFEKKFRKNIYGDSVLCVCYDESGNIAGARALWRNDVEGKIAYQPCDTCVLKEHRRQGLFEKMTDAAMSKIEPGAVIYNYPNDNSRHLYLKLGWSVYGEFKPKFWKGYASYHAEHPEILSDAYYDWWLSEGTNIYRKIGEHYFLVRKYGRFLQMALAEITKETASKLPKAGLRPLLFWSVNKTFYNKDKESKIIVYKQNDDIHIPVWKMDVL